MANIIITENQLRGLTKKLNEDSSSDNKYRMSCKVDLNYFGSKFKGKEINDISVSEMTLTFSIDMEGRSYGIKDISVYNVQGPSEFELEVDYYNDEGDDTDIETITLPLNWDNVTMEKDDELSYIGIGSTIQIDLINDENGELAVDDIIVNHKSI